MFGMYVLYLFICGKREVINFNLGVFTYSLLCGPISPVVNLEMSSTARFFCGNAIYGCSGLGNCRMLNILSIAFCVIDLISMLIR